MRPPWEFFEIPWNIDEKFWYPNVAATSTGYQEECSLVFSANHAWVARKKFWLQFIKGNVRYESE